MTFTLDFQAAYEWFMALSTFTQVCIYFGAYLVIGIIVGKVAYAYEKDKTRENRETAMSLVLMWGFIAVLILPFLIFIAVKYIVTGKGWE